MRDLADLHRVLKCWQDRPRSAYLYAVISQ